MRKFRFLPALLALLLVLGLAACGSSAPPPAASEPPASSQQADLPASAPPPSASATAQSSESKAALPKEQSPPPQSEQSEPQQPEQAEPPSLDENGSYTTKEDVALYIHLYGKLPPNFITKAEAEKLGWQGGGLEKFAPGKCIGGNRFGNYEGLLPKAEGRSYTECDIDTLGASKRGAKRIVFSNDGLIYYTDDHYESFELLYGEE